jgi:hypothetical protein
MFSQKQATVPTEENLLLDECCRSGQTLPGALTDSSMVQDMCSARQCVLKAHNMMGSGRLALENQYAGSPAD